MSNDDGRSGLRRAYGAAGTDREGRARFGPVPDGVYQVRGAGIREPDWVFPEGVSVQVGSVAREETVSVTPSAVLEGYVELDCSGLEPAQRAYALRRPPSQLVLRQGDRYLWGPLTPRGVRADGQPVRLDFRLRGAGPGTWHVVPRSALGWSGAAFGVSIGGDRQRVIVLAPAVAALDEQRDTTKK